jgi:uncharacterized protein
MTNEQNKCILVPHQSLNNETLYSLIDSYLLREGTDYGLVEVGLEQKRAQVLNSLTQNKVFIVFNPEDESVNIVSQEDLKSLNGENRDT